MHEKSKFSCPFCGEDYKSKLIIMHAHRSVFRCKQCGNISHISANGIYVSDILFMLLICVSLVVQAFIWISFVDYFWFGWRSSFLAVLYVFIASVVPLILTTWLFFIFMLPNLLKDDVLVKPQNEKTNKMPLTVAELQVRTYIYAAFVFLIIAFAVIFMYGKTFFVNF